MLHSYFTGVVCLLDLSWSTFVLHSYFTGVVLSPRFKLEYFCVTFVL